MRRAVKKRVPTQVTGYHFFICPDSQLLMIPTLWHLLTPQLLQDHCRGPPGVRGAGPRPRAPAGGVLCHLFFCTISPFSFSIKKTNPFSQLLSLVTAMKKRFRSHPPEKHSNPIGCTTPITFHPNLEQSFLASAKKYGINCFNLFSQSSTVPPSKHFAPPSPRWMAGG